MASRKGQGPKKPFAYCVGSPPGFDPAEQARSEDVRNTTLALLDKDDFAGAIRSWFKIPARDSYVYHAMGSCVLDQVQHVVGLGAVNSLHDWYADTDGKYLPRPPQQDILAYTALFSPTASFQPALRSLSSNAKKQSIRASVAAHLSSKRFIHPHLQAALAIPRLPKSSKRPFTSPPNPYLDFWSWSCRALEWAGPCPESNRLRPPKAHHVLPILMHHFGCACPSHESLEILRLLSATGAGDGKSRSKPRTIADVGSGGGYWTYCLRARGVPCVAVDSAQSEWRASWVPDTVIADGALWLSKTSTDDDDDDDDDDLILLLVYPVVGGGAGAGGEEGSFTRGLLDAYAGDTVVVVGTQNANGYTGFSDMTMDQYMARERPEWTRVIQIPLPSFAGKDEAMYVYQRGERAPPSLLEAGEGTVEDVNA